MVNQYTPEHDPDQWVTPSRRVHVVTGAVATLALFISVIVWPVLLKDPSQAFGTVGLFLTGYGVLFSIIEVLRTQSAALAAGQAAARAADLARSPYDMRDVAECATTIETAIYAMQHGAVPRSQPLSRIIRLYTSIFEDKYGDAESVQRIRLGIVQSHVGMNARGKNNTLLEVALAEMLSDISAKSGNMTLKVGKK